LDFIGEIVPSYSGQHKYILTATYCFTKWIEAIPTIRETDKVIMQFLEENIFARFGCPGRLITDNAQAFKYDLMIAFCDKYNIMLSHSTTYYPQGNGLAESSNKILIKIIKNMLVENKKSWDSNMKYAMWEDRISIKKSIGVSHFQLVYGIYSILPIQLSISVMNYLQDDLEESNDVPRRFFQLIELQQKRETINEHAQNFKDKMKIIFDKKEKQDTFQTGDLVLKWDARREEKSKHGKFDNLWVGSFCISQVLDNNTFILQNVDGE